jgi:Fe-S-cluster containining protein
MMQFAPWRYIADWKCIACGKCCKLYSVVLNFHEWLKIVKRYGVEQTASGLDKLYIKRKDDGSCVFLCQFSNTYVCGLQNMKPKACKLWPFKILTKPEYGNTNQAAYNYRGNTIFIYADAMCNGLVYGHPSWEFAHNTLREFVEIAMDLRSLQHKTTIDIGFPQPYTSFRMPYARHRF